MLMNKIVDLRDINYSPQFSVGFAPITAIQMLYLVIATLSIIFIILTKRAVKNDVGSTTRDIVFGGVAFTGLVLSFGMWIIMITNLGTVEIPFFFWTMQALDIYHRFGIPLVAAGLGYFIVTE